MATAEQAAWIKRVLGLSIEDIQDAEAVEAVAAIAGAEPGAEQADGPWSALLPVWRDAKEEIDGDIARLQAALRATGDDDLEQIADAGLYGVTTGQSVRLQAALRDADADGGSPATRKKVVTAVKSFRDYLEGAPIVDLLERNAWQPVPLRRVLGRALNELERQAAA